jgi:hypothetical protein
MRAMLLSISGTSSAAIPTAELVRYSSISRLPGQLDVNIEY